MTCKCDICNRGRAVRDRLALLPESERSFWENIYDDVLHLELDLGYYKSIVDGSWPGADEVIAGRRKQVADRKQELTDSKV